MDLLTVGEAAIHPAFHLLDHVPDVDLSRREPLDPALEPVARTVRTSSGFQVEVVDQEPETVEFHFVLVDGTGHVVGQVRRRRAVWAQSPALFAGSQARAHGEYDVHVDTSFGDPPSASLILRNLLEAVPDE